MKQYEEKVIDFEVKKPTFKQRLDRAWNDIRWKAADAVDWCKDHPQEAVAIATIAGTVGFNIFKFASKQHTLHATQMLKERYIYDRSNGHYFKMNRVPSTAQWLEIEARKKAGESLGSILQDMKLL